MNEEDLLATAGVAVVRGVRRDARLGSADRHDGAGGRAERDAGAAEAAGGHRQAEAVHHRRQVRHAAVRLPRRSAARTPASTSRSPSGSPATRSAVSSASRSSARRLPCAEPLLTGGRVDLVISTFTYTADRDTRIDFSRAYYKATGRLLVKNDSPIQSLNDIRAQTVATTTGSIYDRWMRRCFPTAEVLVDGERHRTRCSRSTRAGRTRSCSTTRRSLSMAATDPNAKLTDDLFLEAPYGIGIRQGNVALKRWVDARLEPDEAEGPSSCRSSRTTCRAAVRRRVLEEHPAAEQHVHVRAATLPSVDTVCSVGHVASSTTKGSGRARAAAP